MASVTPSFTTQRLSTSMRGFGGPPPQFASPRLQSVAVGSMQGNGMTRQISPTRSVGQPASIMGMGSAIAFSPTRNSFGCPTARSISPVMSSSYGQMPTAGHGVHNTATAVLAPQFAPMPVQFTQPEFVQQGGDWQYRPLSEDRIRRAPAVYKGDSINVAPGFDTLPAGDFGYAPEPALEVIASIVEPIAAEHSAPEPVPVTVAIPFLENVELMQALNETIPPGPRVCVLGGQKFSDPESQVLVEALAAEFSAHLADRVVVLTGGMKGIQETFAKGCVQGPPVVNLLPTGEASNFGVGVDFTEFADLKERIAVFGQIGDIYISVEGGPGVAKEAIAAHSRGAVVIPLISSGGASGGKFDYPPAALEQPSFATDQQWELVKTKGAPEASAQAVVDMVSSILSSPHG